MGLAEPRKRIKIAHDPRNLAWTNSSNSYGQRLMQQQGWKAGDALGARSRGQRYGDTEAGKVVVHYKDDTLGLGATLKSKDPANQRTGFDAFQGLLGRLNAKTEEEVRAVEKKLDDKRLAMFAQGRWGGMVFVPGGLLVQTDPFKQKLELEKVAANDSTSKEASIAKDNQSKDAEGLARADKARRKAEKMQRKEEKRRRKERKRLQRNENPGELGVEASLPTPDSSGSDKEPGEKKSSAGTKRKTC